jgi:hypothetical protein
MALSPPRNLTRGTVANADHIQENDTYLADALDDYHGTYKTILEAHSQLGPAAAIATYIMNNTRNAGTSAGVASAAAATLYVPSIIAINAATYAVNGYTTKLRLKSVTSTNGNNPTGNITYGLHAVTHSSSGGFLILTAGGAVSGSTHVRALAAGLEHVDLGTDFNLPSSGLYVLTMANSAILAANSAVVSSVQLQYRNV